MECKMLLKTDTAKTNETSKNGGYSFEKLYLISKHNSKTNKKPLHIRKLKFIDEIAPEKSVEEIVNVESFKQYNVNIMDEIENQSCRNCTCLII
jgi:aspartate carbamoyltransferase regulatory subunit